MMNTHQRLLNGWESVGSDADGGKTDEAISKKTTPKDAPPQGNYHSVLLALQSLTLKETIALGLFMLLVIYMAVFPVLGAYTALKPYAPDVGIVGAILTSIITLLTARGGSA